MRAKRHMRMRYKYDDSGEPYAPADQQAEDEPVKHLLDSFPGQTIAEDSATAWRHLIIDLKLTRYFGVSVEKMPHVVGWYGVYASKQPTAESFDMTGWIAALDAPTGSRLRLRMVSHGTHRA